MIKNCRQSTSLDRIRDFSTVLLFFMVTYKKFMTFLLVNFCFSFGVKDLRRESFL